MSCVTRGTNRGKVNSPVRDLPILPLRHIHQLESWDCGIACVLMVLLREECNDHKIEEELKTLSLPFLETRSVWTIDLALILARRGVSVKLYTSCDGMKDEYKDYDFYRDHYENDLHRLPALFDEFNNLMTKSQQYSSTPITRCRLPLDALKSNLITSIFIVLVDLNILDCKNCSIKKTLPDLINPASSSSFNGHFIILTSYELATDLFEFVDPASPHERCFTTSINLEKARSSLGTDDDILEILLHNN